MDTDYITEADLDPREENGYIVLDGDLMTYEEWWREHRANFCCATTSEARMNDCACGGYGDSLPSGASRLLAPEEPDGEEWHDRYMESREAYGRTKEDL